MLTDGGEPLDALALNVPLASHSQSLINSIMSEGMAVLFGGIPMNELVGDVASAAIRKHVPLPKNLFTYDFKSLSLVKMCYGDH